MSKSKPRTIILLGAAGSGKSSLAGMFGSGEFLDVDPSYAASYQTSLIVDLSPTSVRIVDLPDGDPRLAEVLIDSVGFILVYSITDLASFEALEQFRERIVEAQRGDEHVSIMLVGSKVDLEEQRAVSCDAGRELATTWGCPFRELSAKDEASVDAAFLYYVRTMRQSYSATEIKHEVIIVANALSQVRHAYNVFKKDREMSVADCRTIFREISNPFPEARLDQMLARVIARTSEFQLGFKSNASAQEYDGASRLSPRSSVAGTWPVTGVSISFTAFLQIFCLWVEAGLMTRSSRIRRAFHVPRSVMGQSSRVLGEAMVTDTTIAVLDKAVLNEAFLYIRKLFNLFDQNQDSQIDFAELRAALKMLTGSEPAESDVQAVLQELDMAGTGTLTFEEFLFVFYLLSVEDDEDETEGEAKSTIEEGPDESTELRIAVRSGYLSKKSSIVGLWLRKFCVLNRTKFYVFRSANQKNPLSVVDLSGDCYVNADEETGLLTINNGGDIMEFRAATPSEVLDWQRDIRSNLVSFGT